MSNEKQYRYPGTRPFTENDRVLFFGRNEDIEGLYKQILLEQLIVLFGKSGLGKSSLLNAGVLPLFKESNQYLVIPVRIGLVEAEKTPARIFLQKMETMVDSKILLWNKALPDFKENWNDPQTGESFWLACKSLQMQHGSKTILLVFDQFEELFTYTETDVARFSQLLASLLFGEMPQTLQNSIYEKLETGENTFTTEEIEMLFEKVIVKLVISIRSDKMSFLNRLKKYIPQILHKTYELKALKIPQAKDALLNPATALGDFISPPFSYEPQAEEKIINYLSLNQEDQIETFQLQLICQFCENWVIKNLKPSNIIKVDDLGDLSTIFTRHYDNLINEINDPGKQLSVRKLIEENLIIEGVRVPLPDKVIITKQNIDSDLLKKLVDSRLLRCEPNNVDGYSYEISHDTLVEPIMKSYKVRIEQEEKERKERQENENLRMIYDNAEKERLEHEKKRKQQRKIIAIVSSAALVFLALAVFGIVMWQKSERMQRKVETAVFDKAVKERYIQWRGYGGYENSSDYKEKNTILDQIDTLNFSENALLHVPLEVSYCKRLKHINLLGNPDLNWSQFAKTRKILPALNSLYVSVDDLNRIPEDFQRCITGIQILHYKLKAIPSNIFALKQLNYLDFSGNYKKNNKFNNLPSELFKQQNLRYLNFSWCGIDSLPTEIGDLINLKELVLSFNILTNLPSEIGKLKDLTYLNLKSNLLETLPIQIGDLEKLTELDANFNILDSLPIGILKLRNLNKLDLSYNKLTTLPPQIRNLVKLTSLILEHNNFSLNERQKINKWLPKCHIYW
jgi:Leucine-rich repeat (LRR) protein